MLESSSRRLMQPGMPHHNCPDKVLTSMGIYSRPSYPLLARRSPKTGRVTREASAAAGWQSLSAYSEEPAIGKQQEVPLAGGLPSGT